MARTHARLLVTLWDDADWLALTSAQHDVYTALLTTHDLSWCGVAPLLPQRLVAWSSDLTHRKVQACLDVLASDCAGRFLVIDPTTGEVLVRSFVRHDDLLKQPNVTKAMLAALARVRSETVRLSVVAELGRTYKHGPDLKGWQIMQALSPELFEEVLANPSGEPFAKGIREPLAKPFREGMPN